MNDRKSSLSNAGSTTGPMAPSPAVATDEDVDLTPEHRLRVVSIFAKLDTLNHYELLGISRDADKKEIKKAYFDAAAAFHPDRFFRKRLGTYKLQMEAIFGRMTQAHDILTKPKKREDYDNYLGDHARSRGLESLIENAFAEARRVETEVLAAVGEIGEVAATRETIPPSATATEQSTEQSAEALKARREALARRLLGPGRKPAFAGPVAPEPPAAAKMTKEEAMEALRRRYHDRIRAAKESNARRYADHGTAALAANDPVAAVNALRVAVTLDPDNVELTKSFNEAQTAADTILCEMYVRQAKYEETSGNWGEAAKSWRKVTVSRPNDATAHDHAANALLKAGGDLHEAARLAHTACTLEPHNPAFRTSLASVYMAAGLGLNARRELEAALQLAPHDGTIQALLARVDA